MTFKSQVGQFVQPEMVEILKIEQKGLLSEGFSNFKLFWLNLRAETHEIKV